MVSIDGTFPSFVNVWFGDQSGDIIHHSSNWIVVVAPARRQAGPVDVTLRSNSAGAVLLVRDGFTYVDPQGGSGPTTTMGPTTSTTAGNGGGGAPSTTTTTSSGGGNDATTTTRPGITPTTSPSTTAPSTTGSTTSSTAAPTTSTSGPATTTTTEPPGVERQPRASASGGAIDLGGGLQGVPLSGLGGLGGVPVCMSDPCRATRL